MLVLGIDPGFSEIGFCVADISENKEQTDKISIKEMGVWKTVKYENAYVSADNARRAKQIFGYLNKIKEAYPDIKEICAEAMSYPRSSSAAAKMSITWGLLIAFCEVNKLKLKQYTPKQIKLEVIKETAIPLKTKRAISKDEVEKNLREKLNHINFNEVLVKYRKSDWNHAFDALGAIYAGCFQTDIYEEVKDVRRKRGDL